MQIKTFSDFIKEESTKSVVFSFGRFNPPTTGHQKLIEKVASITPSGSTYRIYASQSTDPKKNPLTHSEKVKFMRKMFPRHGRNIMGDKDVKNAFDILVKLYDQGFRDVTMVAGADRVGEFKKVLNKYNGVKARHGFYDFNGGIKVVSAGERDPDAEDVTGMSASKMRAAVVENDFETFSKGLPKGYRGGKELFDTLKARMNIRESVRVKDTFDPIREAYISGEIFNRGDEVIIRESAKLGKIISRGVNYVMVETAAGKKTRFWLEDISPLEHKAQIQLQKLRKLREENCEVVNMKHMKEFERFVDKLFAKFDIDFNFTKHFADRMGDKRNDPCIKMKELADLITKIYKNSGKNIKSVKGAEAVVKDLQSDLNIPVAVSYDAKNDEFDVVMKTVMRKKNFRTPNRIIPYK